MIVSHNDLYVSSNDSIRLSEDTNLFSYSIECLIESDEQLRNMLIDVYNEAYGPRDILNNLKEFNKKFDFIKIIKYIIDLFNKVITKLFKRFMYLLTELNYSDYTIKKYKKELQNYNQSIEINFEHYNYTNLDAPIPNPDLFLRFREEYQDTLERLKEIGKTSENKDNFIRNINTYKDSISAEISNGYYNKLRKEIVNTSGMIHDNDVVTVDNYATKLFACFRHCVTTPIDGKVTLSHDMIKESLHRFLGSKDLIKKVENQKNKIQNVGDKVVSDLQKKSAKDFLTSGGISIDYDVEFALDQLLKVKAGQLSENCNIYVLAFSAKLDAIKEAIVIDKKILYKALENVIINGGENND